MQNCLSRKSTISWNFSKIFSPAELFQPQINNILEISKDFFDCRIVLAANQQNPGIIQRLLRLKNCLSRKSTKSWKYPQIFRLQNCLSRKSTISWKNPKTFSPEDFSQPQINKILEVFKNFFACRIVLTASQQYPGKIQRLFHLQNSLSRKSTKSWKYSKTFSPAELSQPQINNILEFLKDFFACRFVLAANQQYPGNIQRFFRLQNCLSRKSTKSWKYSKTFPPQELSQPQINNILEKIRDFFACRVVLAANQPYPGNIQRFFRLQNCLSRKSTKSWKYSKTFSPADSSQPQINNILEFFEDFFACRLLVAANQQYPGNIQRFFRLQNCLSRKSTKAWNYSETFPPQELSQPQINKILEKSRDFSPAELSQPQVNNILEKSKDFFTCRILLAANQQNPGISQRFFRLQSCFSRKSTISWKYSKTFPPQELSQPQINNILEKFRHFFACRIVLTASQQYPGKIQRLFHLQSCFSRKSTISGKYPKIFSTAELSQPQIYKILEIFKDFSASRIVLAANQQYPGKIQRFFRLQSCFSRKSTISWKYPKIFSTAELSQPQINKILEVFKNFFACRFVLAANQQYPGIFRRFFRLQTSCSRKSTISWKYPKIFSTAELSQPQINKILELFRDFSASRIVLAANQQNPGNIHRFFACRIVLAASQQYPGKIQRHFHLQNSLSRKSTKSWKYSKTFSPAELSQPQINIILEFL